MNDKGKQFYDYLVSKDIKVPATYEEFQSSMQDSAIASQFHSFVKSKGITVPESVDEFSSVFSIQEAQESVPDVKKKEQTEPTQAVQTQQAAPTQAAPLPGLGGVSEEPTPSPSVGQGVLRDVNQTQPRGEAFISQASDLTRTDVGEPQVDNQELTQVSEITEPFVMEEEPLPDTEDILEKQRLYDNKMQSERNENIKKYGLDVTKGQLTDVFEYPIPEEEDTESYLSKQVGRVTASANNIVNNPKAFGLPADISQMNPNEREEVVDRYIARNYEMRGNGVNMNESELRKVFNQKFDQALAKKKADRDVMLAKQRTEELDRAGVPKEAQRTITINEIKKSDVASMTDINEVNLYSSNQKLQELAGKIASTKDPVKLDELTNEYNSELNKSNRLREEIGDDRRIMVDYLTGQHVDKLSDDDDADITEAVNAQIVEFNQPTYKDQLDDIYIKVGLRDQRHREFGNEATDDVTIGTTGMARDFSSDAAINKLRSLGYEEVGGVGEVTFKNVPLREQASSYVINMLSDDKRERAERWLATNKQNLIEKEALKNMVLLNVDPGKFEKSLLARGVEVLAEESLPSYAIVDKALGFTSDRKLIDAALPLLQEEGIELTKEQEQNLKRTFGEEATEATTGMVPVIAKLALINSIAGPVRTVSGFGTLVDRLSKSKSLVDKGIALFLDASFEEAQMQAAGFEPGTGFGFNVAGKLFKGVGLDKFPIRGKGEMARFNKSADALWNHAIKGATSAEFASNVEAVIKDFEGGETWKNFSDENYSDLSDVTKRMLVNGIAFGVLGARDLGFFVKKGKSGFNISNMEKARDEAQRKGYKEEADMLTKYINEYYAGKPGKAQPASYNDMKLFVENIPENESRRFTVSSLEEVPVEFRDRAKKNESVETEVDRTFLGIPLGKKKVNSGESYSYEITGKEIRELFNKKKEGKTETEFEQEFDMSQKAEEPPVSEEVTKTEPTVTEPTGDIVTAKRKGRLTKFSTPQDSIVGEVTYEDGTKKELTQEEYDALEKQEGLFDVETGTKPVEEAVPTETKEAAPIELKEGEIDITTVFKNPVEKNNEQAVAASNEFKDKAGEYDEGVNDPKFKEENTTVEEISVDDIVPTQERLFEENLKSPSEGEPLVMKVGDKYYVEDGHHRIGNGINADNQTVSVRVYESDKSKQDAIQEQAAGEVPVQPKAKAGEKVEEGKPEAEPEITTQEGKEEVLSKEEAKSEEKVKEFVEKQTPIGLMEPPLLFVGRGRKRRRKPLEDADADKVVTDWMEDVQKIYDAQKTKDKQAAVDEAATNLALSGRLNEIAPDQRLKVLEDIAKQTAAMDEKKSVSITSELQGLTLKEQFKQGFEEYVSAMKQKETDRKEKAKEAAQKKIDAVKERTAKAIDRIKAKKAEEKEKYKGKIENLEKESKANKEARKLFEAIVNDLAKDSGLSQISRNKASELLKSSRDVNAENLERLLKKAVRVIQYEYTRNIVKESDKKISDFKKNIEKNKFGTLTQSAKELAEITTQDIPLGLLPRFVDVIDGVSKKSPSAKDLDELAKFMSEFKNELDQQITDIQFFADVLNDFKIQKETEEIDDYLKQNGFTESQIEFFKNNRKAINAAYKSFYTKDGKELTTQEKIQKISEQMLDAKKVFREMKSNGEAKVDIKKFKGQVQRAVDIADFFNNIQDSDIDYLTRTEANKLPVVFDNLNRGMVTSAEKRIMNRIKGGRNLDAFEKEDPSSPIKRAKTKDGIFKSFVSNAAEFSKLERSFDPSVLKSSRELQEDIEKKVLDYADEAIKGLKGKPLYNQISKVIRPLVGSNTKVARVHETANELFKKMDGSPLHNTTLMSVYFRSREFDLNPNNPKIKNPLQYIDKTLENTKISEKKRAILKGIRSEYFRDGKPLTKEMLSFIEKSKGGPLIEFMDEVMASTKEDVRFMSEVDESNPAEFFDGYQPRSTMENGNKSIEDLLSDVSNSVGRPSLRTSAVQSRKSTVNALTFDAMDDFMRTAASIELQKNVAPALAEVNAFISEAKRSGNEDARIFAETLGGVLDSYVKNTLARDYKQKGLYGNLWSSMGRKVKKNTLAGISKATVESLIQLGKIHIDEDASNAFYKNASMDRNVSNQQILTALNSMNVARAGVLSSEMSRKRSFITDAVRRGDAGKAEELIYRASKTIPGRVVSGIDDFAGDLNTALIKFPDLVGTVQVVIGGAAIRFKEITGKELDFDKLVNDPEYRAKYKDELDASIAYGDQLGTRMGGPGAMEQKSLQDIKGGDIRDLNRFVRSFSTNENEQILSALTTLGVPTSNVVMGKRERGAEFENKRKAARGLASSLFGLGAYTSLRMAVGTLIIGLFGAILNGDDWDDEFDYWDWDVFKARVLGDTIWTALFGKLGIAESLIAQTLISFGIRQAYKASGKEELGNKIADGMFYSTIDQNDRATKTFKMLGPEGKLAGSILETMYIASDAYEKENFDLLSDPRFKNNLFTISKGALNLPAAQDVGIGVRKAWYGRDENRKVRESFGKMGDSKIIDRSEKEVLRLYKKTRDRFVLPSIIKDKPRKIRERGVSFDVFIAPFSVRDLQKLKGDFIKREMDKLITTKKYRNSSDSGKIDLLKEVYKNWNNASSIKSISKGKYESVDDFYLKNASMKPIPSK